jgi:tripartite-type tricarboxylate transporter receptor subunit TctC
MVRSCTIVCLLAAMLPTASFADDNFYQGKTVSIVVGYGIGGGYDNAARLIGRHLGRHIPGNPNVIVQNMEGAGSLRAANHVYSAAPQDGTVIAAVNQSLPIFDLVGVKGVRFETSKLNWLGSLQASNSVLVTWKASGVASLADAMQREVPLGGSGETSDSNVHAVAINKLAGTRFKVINGYKGARDIHIAIERGEVAGRAGITWSSIVAYDKPWIADGKINVLVQLGDKPDPDLPKVPMLQNVVTSDEDRQIVNVLTLPVVLGFSHWAGPGVPKDRLAILRAAYDATMNDPKFIEEAAKASILLSPKTAAEVETLIRAATSTPRPVLAKVGELLGWNK